MTDSKNKVRVGSHGERLDAYLSKLTGESRSFIADQISQQHVSLNGKPAKPSTRLKEEDVIEYNLKDTRQMLVEPVAGKLDILFEDNSLLVVNKPQGLIVHPAPSNTDKVTLVHYLLYHLQNDPHFSEMCSTRPGIVHRLDKGTSGLLVIAKDRRAKDHLTSQFKERTVKKQYEAIVWGRLEINGEDHGVLNNALGRHRTDRKRMSHHTAQAKDASTEWETLSNNGSFSHVRLSPKTGRTHQLRVHLFEAGYPIVGDPLYGIKLAARLQTKLSSLWKKEIARIQYTFLHAKKLSFEHPVDQKLMSFDVPLPENFQSFLSLMEQE